MTYLDHADIRFANGEVMRIGPNFISEVNVAGAEEDMCWVNHGDGAEKSNAREFTCEAMSFYFAPNFLNSTFAESKEEVKPNAVARIKDGNDVEAIVLYGKKAGEYVVKLCGMKMTYDTTDTGHFVVSFVEE